MHRRSATRALRQALRNQRVALTDQIYAGLLESAGPWRTPPLRSYQKQALEAWQLHHHKGVIVLPTGAGKTRVALAAMASLGQTLAGARPYPRLAGAMAEPTTGVVWRRARRGG